MTRCLIAGFLCLMTGALLAAGPGYGVGGMGVEGAPSYGVLVAGDPCDRGTIFTALKVVRAYRDNEAFAFKHFEGKELEISGRLVAVKHDVIIKENTNEVLFDGYVALVTPDGKAPKPIGLEFRFSKEALKADPQLACDVASLWAGQFVTLRGTCLEAVKTGEYVGVIFNNSSIAR